MSLQRYSIAPWYRAVKVFITVGILAYIFYKISQDWGTIRTLHPRWNLFYLSVSLFSGIGAYLFLIVNWMVILHYNGFFKRRYFNYYFRVWLLSYFYRYVPGKVMLVTERVRMASYLGIPVIQGTIIASLEVLFILYAALIWSIMAFPIVLDSIITALLSVGGSIFFIFLGLPLLFRYSGKIPYIGRYFTTFCSLRLPPKLLALVTCFSLFFWGGLGISLFFFSQMFYSVNFRDMPYLCALFSFAYASGIIAIFSPGGVGIREGILAFGLAQIMPASLAGTLALTARIWFTLVEFILLGTVLTITKPLQSVARNHIVNEPS